MYIQTLVSHESIVADFDIHCCLQVCMITSGNSSVTMARAESETMYIDPETGEVHVFYAGPSEM